MKHPVLYGAYDLTIDDKNRLFIPADIRKALDPEIHGEAFFVITGINRVPWFYAEKYYEELASQAPAELTPGEDLLAFDHAHYALVSRLPWDKQGRLGIPDKTLRRFNITRDVTLIGARDHLELWNRTDWETYRDGLESRIQEIALRGKQARQRPTT